MSITPKLIDDRPSGASVARGILRAYFDRYPSAARVFVCTGETEYTADIGSILGEAFGWMEIESSSVDDVDIGCLLISVQHENITEPDLTLLESKLPPLVILSVSKSGGKTPAFALMEDHGYRMLCERYQAAYFHRESQPAIVATEGSSLGDDEIRSALGSSWWRLGKLPGDTRVDLAAVDPRILLIAKRFDIAIKGHYGRLWLNSAARSWREYVYSHHALRITGGSPEIAEYDGIGKKGLEAFLDSFHSLLGELEPVEIQPVPVDPGYVSFDGSHRIAAAIATGRSIEIAKIDAEATNNASASFFQSDTHGHPPCPTDVLDEAAIEYCRIKDTAAIALVFPTARSDELAVQELSAVGNIVYRKTITMTPEAGGALLKQVYLGQPWLQEEAAESGFSYKQKSCFPFLGELWVILLDGVPPESLRAAKDRIRNGYGVGSHSIHITDSSDETLRLARTLFNANSVDLLNNGIEPSSAFVERLFGYRDWLEASGIDDEAVAIDGSAILDLLGLRPSNDLDFLYHGDPADLPETPLEIDNHNQVASFHEYPIDEIVGDPRLHCWYMGVKFCAPRVIRAMKLNRKEPKDLQDVAMLDERIRPTRKGSWVWRVRQVIAERLQYWRSRLIWRVKNRLRPLVHRLRSR